MIAIPDFGLGAMENWGLITYRETAMLYTPGVSSESNRQRVNQIITHELAHQVCRYMMLLYLNRCGFVVDMITIPDFAAGAMENWGLITYRETAMLFTPGVSSETNRQRVHQIITHELGHQVL